jgi:hypothetical protein
MAHHKLLDIWGRGRGNRFFTLSNIVKLIVLSVKKEEKKENNFFKDLNFL